MAAVERAISACGHVIVDMADFPAADQVPAKLCVERVRGCDVYAGVLGTGYGSPVQDEPEVSYTELEFDAATQAGLDRLMFLLDTDSPDVGIPPSRLIDLEFGARQEAFRRRVQAGGLVTQTFTDPATLGQLVERSLRDLAERRRRSGGLGQREPLSAVVVAGEIPQEPLGFQLRAELLAALDAPGPGTRLVRAVTGMRGVGKTHLAAAYARAKVAERWRLVAWINAEDMGGLMAGLTATAVALNLGSGGGDAQAAARAVRHWLETGGDRCLLVFDNATDPELLQPFLPAAGAARVIITSNQRSMGNLGASVPVDVFSEQEALAFLAERTGSVDANGALAVAAELAYLPLALAQAAAVVTGQYLGYDTYLDRLRSMPVDELLRPVEAGQYPRGVAAAVLLSLDGVRTGDDTGLCTGVMELLTVLSPAGARRTLVQEAALQGFLNMDGQPDSLSAEVVDRALAWLAGASLLTFSVDRTSVSTHRLVMRVIRENLAASDSLAAVCMAAAQLLDRLAESLQLTWHYDRAAVRDLVEQIMALSESSSSCPADSALVGRILHLKGQAVWFLNRLGDSTMQSIQIAEPLLVDQEQMLGADHPGTLAGRNNLAVAYRDARRPDKAIPLLERTLADRERVLGADQHETLSTSHNLALAYRDAHRTDEAIPLLERTLADRERVLGADHHETLSTSHNLALAYRDARRKDEAIRLFEQTLADRERVLGADHPDTLATRNNLANAYRDAGRTDKAIPLLEQTLADRERVLGADHPGTLATRNNLANAHRAAGRTDKAIPLLERTLADRERVLGADHPDTLATRNNLAVAYRAAGRTDKAIPLLERTLADRKRVLGADHPGTLATRNNLANAHRAAGHTDKAIRLFEQTLADRERMLGADHPDTLATRNNLADAYRAAGHTDKAIRLLEQTLADRERMLGADHPDTLRTRRSLARAHRDAGRTAEAVEPQPSDP